MVTLWKLWGQLWRLVPCVLFISEDEKSALGQFAFISYYKSKEMLDRHSNNGCHKIAIERAHGFKQTYTSHTHGIDVRMSGISSENLAFNSSLLPLIAEAVFTCA